MLNKTGGNPIIAKVDSVDLAWPRRLTVNKPSSPNHGQTYIQARMSDGEGNWQTLINVRGLTLAQKQTFLELSANHAIRCIGYIIQPETNVARRPKNPSLLRFDFLDFDYEKDSTGKVKKDEEGDNITKTVPLTLNVNTKHV